VLVKQPPPQGFFPIYKVIQEIGRLNREDSGAIALCHDPDRLDTPLSKSFPITAVGKIVGTGITMTLFDEIFSMTKDENISLAVTMKNISTATDLALFAHDKG
jgi:hypothetical protein